jgi:hypothetical protein
VDVPAASDVLSSGWGWASGRYPAVRRLSDHQLLLELFALVNLGFLTLDIYIAHSVNAFRRPAEYIPLFFSMSAPVLLVIGLIAREKWRSDAVWRDVGYFVGWVAILIGLAGVILHLESRFFFERTLRSLTYAAPFAAPLAYAGLGFLLVMNRMVAPDSAEWPRWVLLMALGGFFGNFVLSLTDHAGNGFFSANEWIPVFSAALAVGFLIVPLLMDVGQRYVRLCAGVMMVQVAIGVIGFMFHAVANLRGPSVHAWDNFVNGAPPMAPLLFPNLALLAFLGLWRFAALHSEDEFSDTVK